MAMLRPWVALKVTATRSTSGTLKSLAALSRQRKSSSAAFMAYLCPPRPGLEQVSRACAMAVFTEPGFWNVVAALSK